MFESCTRLTHTCHIQSLVQSMECNYVSRGWPSPFEALSAGLISYSIAAERYLCLLNNSQG